MNLLFQNLKMKFVLRNLSFLFGYFFDFYIGGVIFEGIQIVGVGVIIYVLNFIMLNEKKGRLKLIFVLQIYYFISLYFEFRNIFVLFNYIFEFWNILLIIFVGK